MFLAWREVRRDPGRFSLIIGVVAALAYLAFFLTSLAYGLASSYRTALDAWQADGVLLAADAGQNLQRSRLDADAQQIPEGVQGAPLVSSLTSVELDDGEQADAALFGVDPDGFIAPQAELGSGLDGSRPRDVVVDERLTRFGVELGDRLRLTGDDTVYTVVGMVRGQTFQTAPVVYTVREAAVAHQEAALGARLDERSANAVVFRGEMPADEERTVLSMDEYIATLPGYTAQIATFALMIGFLIGIAAFVLGIFVYILTLQKRDVIGVMKAQGVPSGYIGRSIAVQSVLLAAIGCALGLGAALATGFALAGRVPFSVQPVLLLGILACFAATIGASSLFSVRAVAKTDPMRAIR